MKQPHWEKTTLRLTPAQARHLWWLLKGVLDAGDESAKRMSSWKAIVRKLEDGK